jgi:hypothetical protein
MTTPRIFGALPLALSFALCTAAATPASAQSVGFTYWSANGGSCTPTDATLRDAQYITVTGGGRVKYRSATSGVSPLGFVCPVTSINPNVLGGDATHMRLYYQDPDGPGTAYQVRAFMRSLSKLNGAYNPAVCQLTSDTTGPWRAADTRCEGIDLANNIYWVHVIISRAAPHAATVEFNGVELAGEIE